MLETSLHAPAGRVAVYIGTYIGGGSVGIYYGALDTASGELTITGSVAAERPSYLAPDPQRRFLYAVSEVDEGADGKRGAISAYALDAQTGQPKLLNTRPSGGAGPCHVSVDPSNRFVFAANYLGGTVAMLPIQSDGCLGAPTDIARHRGSGVNPDRQKEPHAHSITPDPAGRYALAADLGTDSIIVYAIDYANGRLLPNGSPWRSPRPGAGPRHLALHPAGRFVYVINELDSTIAVYHYDALAGTLDAAQTISALPSGFAQTSFAADIHIEPSGRFLYASNRGHDSIAVFAIDAETGRIALQGFTPSGGKTPRGFALDPTGAFLIAANQESGNLAVFAVDSETGLPSPTGQSVRVPNPTCVKMFQFAA